MADADFGGDLACEVFVFERHDQLLGNEFVTHEGQVFDGVLGDDQQPGVVLASAAADQVGVVGAGARVEQGGGFFEDDQPESLGVGEEGHSSKPHEHAVDGDRGAFAVGEPFVEVGGAHFLGGGQIEAAGQPDGDVEGVEVGYGQGVVEDGLGEVVGGPGLQGGQDGCEVVGEVDDLGWAGVGARRGAWMPRM